MECEINENENDKLNKKLDYTNPLMRWKGCFSSDLAQ